MKAFGIGCLWFGLAGKNEHDFENLDFDVEKHIKLIQNSLERIPSISNIKIETDSIFSIVYSDYKLGEQNYEYSFFPLIGGLVVRFRIHLPIRIQQQVTMGPARNIPEDFDVLIKYGYTTPIAIISYDSERHSTFPSSAVVVVRKYLEQQIPKECPELTFNTLGPSPFHADFYLTPDTNMKDEDGLFNALDVSGFEPGYKNYVIKYDADYLDNAELALYAFIEEYSQSIETYYRMILYSYDLHYIVGQIQEHLDAMLSVQNEHGLLALFKRMKASPELNRDIMLAILALESKKLSASSYVEEARNSRSLIPNSIFDEFIRHRENRHSILPIDDIRNTIRIFEDRYLKGIENATVLIAGLLGGIIGSALTYLIGK